MNKLLSILALSSASTLGAMANKHADNQKDVSFYVGFGMGGEHAMHDYKMQDVGITTPTQDLSKSKFSKTGAMGQLLAGVRMHTDSNMFFGLGVEANFGSNQAQMVDGANNYISNSPVSPFILNRKKGVFTIQKDYDLGANLQIGYQMPQTRIYAKLGLNHTQFKYSYESGNAQAQNTNFYNKRSSTMGFVPGLGFEQKVACNTWVGLDLSMPVYKKNMHEVKVIAFNDTDINTKIKPFDGKSKTFKFIVNVKFEI